MQSLNYASSFLDQEVKHFPDETTLSSLLSGKYNPHAGTVPLEGCRTYKGKRMSKVPK